MKGLLLKDLYIIKGPLKGYMIAAVGFIVLSGISENLFFLGCFSLILCNIMTLALLDLDRQSHWVQYSGALPYTRAQIVSAKYCIDLSAKIAILAATTLVPLVRVKYGGTFPIGDYIRLVPIALTASTTMTSVIFPLSFKSDIKEGGAVKLLVVLVVYVGLDAVFELVESARILLVGLINIGIYALSWCLSIVCFEKRDLT